MLIVAALGLPAPAWPAPATAAVAAIPASPAAAHPGTAPVPALSSVIPAPVEVRPVIGADFRLGPLTVIRTQPGSPAARAIGDQLARALRPATGYPLPVLPAAPRVLPTISLLLGAGAARLGTEGYRLHVDRTGVTIRANQPAGLFAGTQTLRQLL